MLYFVFVLIRYAPVHDGMGLPHLNLGTKQRIKCLAKGNNTVTPTARVFP